MTARGRGGRRNCLKGDITDPLHLIQLIGHWSVSLTLQSDQPQKPLCGKSMTKIKRGKERKQRETKGKDRQRGSPYSVSHLIKV